ncbi:MAG: hypothetical protein JW889_08840 [Verrucomicrobia bacterium]|nr:hypothetical protein [Verrucomicrobiota bacterium]
MRTWVALIAAGLCVTFRPVGCTAGEGAPMGEELLGAGAADAEQELVERKLRLAQAYRYRGERGRALGLLRQVQTLQPGNEAAAELVVELWLESWDEQLVAHLESDPDAIKLRPLEEFADVMAVGAGLLAKLGDGPVRAYRDAALIAPYMRAGHAETLAQLARDEDRATASVAAVLLCVLGDPRGDARVRELLVAGLRRPRPGGEMVLLPYASPETWERLLGQTEFTAVRTALLNLAYVKGHDALEQARRFAGQLHDPSVLGAAIQALILLGDRAAAAEAVKRYRESFVDRVESGALGHYLLMFCAGLGDEAQFFDVYNTDEEELRTPMARMLAAQMHVAAGRQAEAEAVIAPLLDEIEAEISAEPEDADLYYRLGYTVAVAGTDPAWAKAVMIEALQRHPRTVLRPQIYEGLARLYLREGKLEQARVLAGATVRLYSTEHPRYLGLQRQVLAAREASSDEE